MTILATVLVVAAGAVFAHTSIKDATEQLRQQAITQLKEAIATQSFGGDLPPHATDEPSVLPTALRTQLRGGSAVTFDDGRWMWAARTQSSGLIATRVDNAPLREQWINLQRTFALAALLAAFFAGAGSWAAAGRLTARLRHAASAVDETAAGRNADTLGGRDEVAVLTRRLAETTGALAQSLDHERAISAEVAHDLRTPVTALLGAAELLPDGADSERVQRIAERLRRLLDDLLDLSRAAHTAGEVRLRPLDLNSAVEHFLQARAASEIRLHRGEPVRVLLDESHLDVALSNLIANAQRHGAEPIEVRVAGAEAIVIDHGPGFLPELLRDGPRRFGALGAGGHAGLGLAIALQHVTAMHARLHLSNGSDGARAAIAFPPLE